VCDRSADELLTLFERAARFRGLLDERVASSELAGARVGFIWDGEGFRNRVAFELGVTALGGTGTQIPGRLGEREDVDDLGRYLDNWFDVLVVRTPSFELLSALAATMSAPVINARTWHNHPCEILGDLAFARAAGKDLHALRVVFVGESTNMLHSWCEAAAVLPFRITQVCPPGYEVDESWLEGLVPHFAGSVTTARHLACLSEADIIYTDRWPLRGTAEQHETVRSHFAPLQIDARRLEAAPADALFLPCPPVTRGEEVSADAMTSSRCRVVEAKDWLLAAQGALLVELTGLRVGREGVEPPTTSM
jgi:ornithine carbamoyltransferase